jgi:KipI family sensor histidine kinase inhibitor
MALNEPVQFPRPRYLPAGDCGILVVFGEGIDESLNKKVRAFDRTLQHENLPGIQETVPAYCSLLIVYDPATISYQALRNGLEGLEASISVEGMAPSRLVEIPVVYGGDFGPDIRTVAEHHGLGEDDVIRLHSSARYLVYMTGFTPGFPYLGGMPLEIATPRLEQPRLRVPAGSVGIAGRQTGVYPLESPGGWRIIGRTPLRLFDPQKPDPVRLHAGDNVQFKPVNATEFDAIRQGEEKTGASVTPDSSSVAAAEPALRVIKPGMLTTVQDLGRRGFLRAGIPPSGAMDRFAFRAANLALGNSEEAAGLEITLWGAQFEFLRPSMITVTGADLEPRLNGVRVALWRVLPVEKGDCLSFGTASTGCRAYLGITGGLATDECLGSRATFLRARIGGLNGRALAAGDVLPAFTSGSFPPGPAAVPRELQPSYRSSKTLRVVLGPQEDAFTSDGISQFLSTEYRVTPASDRMGYRLSGEKISHRAGADIVTDAIPLGAIQVPGDGQPILLMTDRQTTGGYAKIAVVIAADLDRAGQLKPGENIRFEAVTLDEARAAYLEIAAQLGHLRSALRFNDSTLRQK